MKRIFTFFITTILSFSQSYGQCSTVYTAPFSENFNSFPTWSRASFDCGFGFFVSWGSIDPCWSRSSTASTTTGYAFVGGPIVDAASYCVFPPQTKTGSGFYVRPYDVSAVNGQPTHLTSPKIDVSGLTNPEIEVWYNLIGPTNSLYIQAKSVNSSGWVTLDTVTDGGAYTDTLWKVNFTSIPFLGGDTIEVRFLVNHVSNSVVAIDDFKVTNGTPCARVSNVHAASVSDTSITIDWDGALVGNWQIEYGEGIHYQLQGTYTTINANSKPVTISGLLPNKKYIFYVRDSCDSVSFSHRSQPLIQRTECSMLAPFLETFEGNNFSPTLAVSGWTFPEEFDRCFDRSFSNSTYKWNVFGGSVTGGKSTTGPLVDHTTGFGTYMSTNGYGGASNPVEASFLTPLIDISNLQAPVLTFWYYMYGAGIEKLKVSAKGASFDILLDSITGQQQTSNTAVWRRMDMRLDSLPSDIFKIKFVGLAQGWLGHISIDDVQVDDEKVCSDPYSFQLDSVSTNFAEVSWQDSTATYWAVEYGPSGFTPGQGIVDTVVYSRNFAFTGLNPATTYDYYVRGFCGTLNASSTQGPFSFSTTCVPLFASFSDTVNVLTVNLDASQSSGNYVSYQWDFGDGNSGSGATTTHTYISGGNYTIALVASDTCSQVEMLQRNIEVCDSLEAAFTYSIVDTVVTFMAQVAPDISQYYWDFGDGTQDSGAVVQHAYNLSTSSPPFHAKLEVVNNCGKSDSIIETLPSDIRMNEYVLKDVVIYPTPSSSEVFVVLPWLSTQKLEVLLINTAGKSFKPRYSTTSNILRIELRDYASGQYMLQIKLDQNEISKKLIIRKE